MARRFWFRLGSWLVRAGLWMTGYQQGGVKPGSTHPAGWVPDVPTVPVHDGLRR
ncbi:MULTISPECIES: hypothetical protein [unclassified Nocardia]|uniref:hypothetical protein n=1 Tax=unclassified Nocardia TaxID=2637762 RepID=UPI00278C8D90|nr:MULTISPECIES: hypothetical protein [unclassified Nocardia]